MTAVNNARNALGSRFQSTTNLFATRRDYDGFELASRRNSSPILPLHIPREPGEGGNRATQRASSSNAAGDDVSIGIARSLDLEVDRWDSNGVGTGELLTVVGTTSQQVAPSIHDDVLSNPLEEEAKLRAEEERIELEYEKCDCGLATKEYKGIPLLSRFQSSSSDLEMFRMFKIPHLRILNQMQIKINEIHKKLSKLDRDDANDLQQEYRLVSTEIRPSRDAKQIQLLKKLTDGVKEYQQFLLNYKQISAMSPPAERNHKDLFKHILNYSVLKEGYRDVIYEKEDYICFVDTHANYVETQLHNLYRMVPYHWLKTLFKKKRQKAMNQAPFADYYSKARLSNLARAFSVCLVVGILLAPVFILFLVPLARGFMALIAAAFLVLFAGMLTWMTESKLEVVFVGTATYGAVLIMFLGNLDNGNTLVPR